MFEYRVRVDDFKNTSIEETIEKAKVVLEAAIELNRLWLRKHPDQMCLLACGKIEYAQECEFDLIPYSPIVTGWLIPQKRRLMCIDIVGLDVAIRRERGQCAEPDIYPLRDAGVFHVVTDVYKNGRKTRIDPTQEIREHGRAVTDQPRCSC